MTDQMYNKLLELVREKEHEQLANFIQENRGAIAGKLDDLVDGNSAVHLCVGHLECLRTLLLHGAKPDLPNKEQKQPIHLAAERDYVETVMMLAIKGADINALSDGKTPLQLAVEKESLICQDFLHFLCAKIPIPDSGSEMQNNLFDSDTKQKYDIMQKGLADGHVRCGWADIPKDSTDPVEIKSFDNKPVGIAIKTYDEPCMVFVRKMQAEFQTSNIRIPGIPIGEELELVSDIYQYRVDINVKCDIHVPVMDAQFSSKYQKPVVVCSVDPDNPLENVEITNGKAVIKGTQLFARGFNPIVAFGIFLCIKVDTISRDDPSSELIVQSSVENLFKVVVPPGTAPSCTELELKVMRADSSAQSTDSGIGSSSDFHSVSGSLSPPTVVDHPAIDSQNSSEELTLSSATCDDSGLGDEVYVTLPRPKGDSESHEHVYECRQGADGCDADNWTKHNHTKVTGKTLECYNCGFAIYIAISIKRKTLAYQIREFVCELFSRSMGNKQKCKLFATIKENNKTQWMVMVVLCKSDEYDQRVKECLQERFKEQEIGPSGDIDINTKCTYMLKLVLTKAKVLDGPDAMPIQYNDSKLKSQKFTIEVTGDHASITVMKFKNEVPKDPKHYEKKVKAKMPIWFQSCKKRTVQEDRFASDAFITKAQTTIGIKWFPLGMHLGFTCAQLCDLIGSMPQKRNCLILYNWRDGEDPLEQKLDNLMIAVKQEYLPDLRKEVLSDAVKFRHTNHELDQWIRKYKIPGRDEREAGFQFCEIKPKPVSPLEDKFLLIIAKRIEKEGIIAARLGMNIFREMPDNITDPIQRKCWLLMLVKDRFDERVVFLKHLVNAMKENEQILSVKELSSLASEWFHNGHIQEENTYTLNKLRSIFQIKGH